MKNRKNKTSLRKIRFLDSGVNYV